MDRRSFGKYSLATLGSLLFSSCGNHAVNSSHQAGRAASGKKLSIQYARQSIPAFDVPAYRGQSYEDTVPDSLDIAERAQLGINAVTRITDPDADYEIYMWVNAFHNPPIMTHDFNDWCQLVEGIMEGLPLLRTATGSDLNADVDRAWMQALLKSVGPDGLVYVPLNGRPWGREGLGGAPSVEPVWRADGTRAKFSDPSVTQITTPCIWARALGTMGVYYVRDRNPIWKQTMQRMVDRATALAVNETGYAFYAAGSFEPNARVGSEARKFVPSGGGAVDIGNGRLIQGLAQCYRLTGYEPAAKLAGKLTNFVRHHIQYYDPEGRFLPDPADIAWAKGMYPRLYPAKVKQLDAELAAMKYGGHFHTHTIGLLSMIEYAVTVRDRELLDWTRASYEWARMQGGPQVGFMPEEIVPDYPSCESCEVADMIQIALKLTDAGVGDYWDDVDRWTRNQFAENQLTSPDWVYHVADLMPRKPVPQYSTGEQVPERNVGAFAGWARGNEWVAGPANYNPLMVMQCCTGNSIRAVYYVWERILEYKDNRLRVNLLLNRASQWGDIHSYIPYDGRIDLKIKKICPEVLVRVPEWVRSESADVKARMNGEPRKLRWEGRYVNVGRGLPGETITVTFPIPSRKVKETMGGVTYTLELKGSTVVSISPEGANGPLYQRVAFRNDRVRWRKMQRFVPEAAIAW